MSTAGPSYRRPNVALPPSAGGSSSTLPQTLSSNELLPSSTSSERMPDPAGSTGKGKGKAAAVDFLHGLPALPPVSPLVRPSCPSFVETFVFLRPCPSDERKEMLRPAL